MSLAIPDKPTKSKRDGNRLGFLSGDSQRAQFNRIAHERYVGLMKFLLPTGAILLMILVAVWPYIEPNDDRVRLGSNGTGGNTAAEATVTNARYVGNDSEGRPFTVTADLARNLTPEATEIELVLPKADIVMKDGKWLALAAETGLFMRNENRLILSGMVSLLDDAGHQFLTDRVTIDLRAATATGDDPITGHGPFGALEAEGFEMTDRGRTLKFKGASRLLLRKTTETK